MSRLLFVDDDQDVLEGIENRLQRHRHQFSARYADCGPEALRLLAQEPFDAVITDMRMPGMNGAELLRRVREAYPGLLRIILSGDTGQEGWLEAMRVAHQTLSKPCDVTVLGSALEQLRGLSTGLASRDLEALLGRAHVLPTPTRLIRRLDEVLGSGDPSLGGVATIVEEDAALTARLLQIANSAYFAGGHRCERGLDAVRCLGLEAVRGLALAHELYGQMRGLAPESLLEALHGRALRTAAVARRFCRGDDRERQRLVTAAILQDIGGLALLDGGPAPAGVDRGTLSGYLLTLWGLPVDLIRTVAAAGQPGRAGLSELTGAGTLHLAQCLVGELEPPDSALQQRLPSPALDTEFCRRAGIDDRAIAVWRALAQDVLAEAAP